MEKRRRTLRSGAEDPVRCAAAAVLLGLAAARVIACELPAGGEVVDSPRHTVSYRPYPDRIKVGEHFALDLSVCAKDGQPPPAAIAVDAWMPAHRHGMNYKATLKAFGGGRFRAEGLMFHMPGRWEFLFDVGGERIIDSVQLE
jgi:YtkA-like protein